MTKFTIQEYCANPTLENRNRFIQENTALIHDIVHKKFNYPHLQEDLIQEGRIALDRCLVEYKPSNGKFSSFAYISIKNRLVNWVNRNSSTIKYSKITPLSLDDPDTFLPSVSDSRSNIILNDIVAQFPISERALIPSLIKKGGKMLTSKEYNVASKIKFILKNKLA